MKKKLMFVAGTGGHLSEILKLEPLFDDYVIVTEKTQTSIENLKGYNVEYLKYGSRYYFLKYIFVFIVNVLLSIKLVLKYRPNIIITTGPSIGGIIGIIGKCIGSKFIYIESLAKVNTLSITGKTSYRFADKFYVQWEDLCKKYEKAEYIGRLI